MFAVKRVLPPFYHRRSHLSLRTGHDPRKSQRTLFTSAVETLAEEFLDLALALPFPSSLPPYSTTIILFTVASRLAFTVPISVWVRVCDISPIPC
jgi:mitochondrial inner membrane protein COX18